MYDLLRSALRHRPEYIVVGEVRGEEAMTLFQAMNTGHTTYSTMHADSVQTAINRLENEPINVPRSMVQSLDVLAVQTLTRTGDQRVRRNKVLAEIEGVDQRTGELDYSMAYTWNSETDSFRSAGSKLLSEIRDERGWSQQELLTELANRKRFLEYLQANGIDDYQRFTALVNEYYSDPDRILETIADETADAVDVAADDVDDVDIAAGHMAVAADDVNDATNRADDAADETVDNPTGDDESAPTRLDPGSVNESARTETDDARDG